MPRISIVIPAKNEEKVLPVLLKTIKAQTSQDFEVILADAKSTDRTPQIAKDFGARVIEGGMPGPGRNKGAKVAKGDVIFFFDADVQLPSTRFLQDCLSEFDRKKLDIATVKVKPLTRSPLDRALHEAYNAYVLATEKVRPHAPGSCLIVRRAVHEAVDGFDESVVFAEDHDYVQRIWKRGFKFGILRSHPIGVSVRRLEKDGRLGIALKYIYGEIHMATIGPFKESPFEYRMGGDADEEDEKGKNSK